MHSYWFIGTDILQGRWQHGEKVGYCYPSGLEKTLCKWDNVCPAGHERVKSPTYWPRRTDLKQLKADMLHAEPSNEELNLRILRFSHGG
jgi:hypothetical protein